MDATPQHKTDFYRRWELGEFGNRIRTLTTLEALQESNYDGLVSVRYREPSSPWCRYEVPAATAAEVVADFVVQGADPARFTFNESAPDNRLTMQGEVMLSCRHYELLYSTEQAPMRIALQRSPKRAHGLGALLQLRANFWPKSYDMLQDLLSRYDDGVVEFSCYDRAVGELPGHNTLIWEVRNY